MWSSAREIAAGDTVIVWLTRDQVQPLVVSPGKDFNTKFGNFKQSDFIGVPYGSKVVPKSGRGFIYILRPTPELWTIALPHRTQILYLADIAFIVSWLGIKKGSNVIEAGKMPISSFAWNRENLSSFRYVMQMGMQFLKTKCWQKHSFPLLISWQHGKAPDRLPSLIPFQERSVQQVIYGPMNSMKRGSTKQSMSSSHLILISNVFWKMQRRI